MSTTDELDVLLYAWLSEPEVRRAELRFNSYFQVAFPTICRYIRSLRTDPATAQDIAQHALIKLFNHLGTGRRATDKRMREALSALRPLDFGVLHATGIYSWRRQVGSFRDAATGFHVPRETRDTGAPWKESRDEINGRIPPLVRQGTHFISDVRTRVEAQLANLVSHESLADRSPSSVDEPHSGEEDTLESVHDDAIDRGVERFLTRLLICAHGRDSADIDAALGCAGAVAFLTHTSTVRACLPTLAIPSNGLLYTIAKRQFLDRFRARKLQTAEGVQHLADSGSESVLETLDSEETNERDDATHEVESRQQTVGDESEEPETEVEARYQAFLEFLRAPLTSAEGALAAAAAKGKGKAEQARVDSLRAKYDRLMAVLAALREDPQPTEEEIARRHGLTRNQVKYVIERIREEFNNFFPELAHDAQGRRKQQRAEF